MITKIKNFIFINKHYIIAVLCFIIFIILNFNLMYFVVLAESIVEEKEEVLSEEAISQKEEVLSEDEEAISYETKMRNRFLFITLGIIFLIIVYITGDGDVGDPNYKEILKELQRWS